VQNLSVSALADLVGMTRETVTKRLSAAGLVGTTGAHNATLYDSKAALTAIFEAKINDQTALMNARAENLAADTRLKNIKEQEMLGQLAPIDALGWALGSVCAQISGILESLPAKLKRRMPQLTAADVHLIQTEIAKARNAAASATIQFPE
jgi:phage terminase Nu1 subunit (DNA packaging protein)